MTRTTEIQNEIKANGNRLSYEFEATGVHFFCKEYKGSMMYAKDSAEGFTTYKNEVSFCKAIVSFEKRGY